MAQRTDDWIMVGIWIIVWIQDVLPLRDRIILSIIYYVDIPPKLENAIAILSII